MNSDSSPGAGSFGQNQRTIISAEWLTVVPWGFLRDRLPAILWITVASIGGAGGCPSVTVDLTARACDQTGACLEGFSCDAETNICVTGGDRCEPEGRVSPCAPGATDCTDGCRRCASGVWTACMPPEGEECVPASAACDGNELVRCGPDGFIASRNDCGVYGCNTDQEPSYCNECLAEVTSCVGTLLVTCGLHGVVTESIDCGTASRCSNAGFCDPVSLECDTVARAPDGTPCDDGAGANGDLCDSACQGGICTDGATVACDDGDPCTGPDTCDELLGCLTASAPAGVPCGDLCNRICDGAGACLAGMVNCADDNVCTGPDTCIPNSGCDNPPNNGPCEDGDPCTINDRCANRACAPGDPNPCADDNPCTEGDCDSTLGCLYPASDCSGTAGQCHGDNFCSQQGAPGNCDLRGTALPDSDGQPCDDCPAGPGQCDTCLNGNCLDLGWCDGSAAAAACTTDADCAADPFCFHTGDCITLGCVDRGVEHQACADTEDGAHWGPTFPCRAVSCVAEADNPHPKAIGEHCFSSVAGTTAIHYEIYTESPTGQELNLWMRNAVDDNWAGETYSCTLTGVTSVGTYAFSFAENDLDNATRHGSGCGNYSGTSRYCWMAADGDASATNGYQPIPLDQGLHLLDCSFVTGGNGRDAGFDGIIFTAQLSFVPSERDGPLACDGNDQVFTAGGCVTTNWGPNTAPSAGRCQDRVPVNEGNTCFDCPAADGRCQICRNGACLDGGICDGATDPCTRDADCADYGMGCAGPASSCSWVGCAGAAFEHHACADTVDGTRWGPGMPCVAVTCTSDDSDAADAIGGDCFSQSRLESGFEDTEIRYTFRTESPSGTPFNLWMRNAVDDQWDALEQYDCIITGVTGTGAHLFSFVEADLDGLAALRHGPGCGDFTATSRYCWMAMDGDDDDSTYDPIPLDPGEHLLSCTISLWSTDTNSEDAGFDGFIFTADLGFVPQEGDAVGACNDSDQRFTASDCVGVNWGPDSSYQAGFCSNALPANDWASCTDCDSGDCAICRAGFCLDRGSCDGATEACINTADCAALGAGCEDLAADCVTLTCAGGAPEHRACADTEDGNNWGPGRPCQKVTCNREDDQDGDFAIGEDCYSQTPDPVSGSEVTEIEYELNTTSPSGTLFNLWMRNLVDANWGGGAEFYDCYVTGVTGVGTYAFSFLEGDLVPAGALRHGSGCRLIAATSRYCWMAVDGNTNAGDAYQPLALDRGAHALHCEISMVESNLANRADAGFDGIIFTTDLGFVPAERYDPIPCGDQDEAFTSGACATTNWGVSSSPEVGFCAHDARDRDGEPCTDGCPGTGPCSFCWNGACLDAGLCDESEACATTAECLALGGACVDAAIDDCVTVACADAVPEHQACSDAMDGTFWGDGLPCEAVACVGEDDEAGPGAIGADCYSSTVDSDERTEILYAFRTESPSGTAFNLWLRNIVDAGWDDNQGEWYDCFLTGVTGSDTFFFGFREANLISGRHGLDCSPVTDTAKYCWMAVDGNDEQSTYDPVRLDRGAHTLGCMIPMSEVTWQTDTEDAGFDGMIFTTDLDFVPDTANGVDDCGGLDATFTSGTCAALNWGPGSLPMAGVCVPDAPIPNGTPGCAAGGGDTCCNDGTCTDTAGTGICP